MSWYTFICLLVRWSIHAYLFIGHFCFLFYEPSLHSFIPFFYLLFQDYELWELMLQIFPPVWRLHFGSVRKAFCLEESFERNFTFDVVILLSFATPLVVYGLLVYVWFVQFVIQFLGDPIDLWSHTHVSPPCVQWRPLAEGRWSVGCPCFP